MNGAKCFVVHGPEKISDLPLVYGVIDEEHRVPHHAVEIVSAFLSDATNPVFWDRGELTDEIPHRLIVTHVALAIPILGILADGVN